MSKGTILVVDDEVRMRELLSRWLELAGYTVHTASNGKEGLEQVRRQSPDLLITDVLMPVMDGYEFCRQTQKLADVPVIILTGQIDLSKSREIIRDMNLRVDALMNKPARMSELLAQVEALLDNEQDNSNSV